MKLIIIVRQKIDDFSQ